jgi:hypothetical protein
MSYQIVKGKIQNYERSEKYDDDGNKIIHYWIIVNSQRYTVDLPGKSDIYFDNGLEVVLSVNNNQSAVGGICPKKGYKWGNTGELKGQVKSTDRFEFIEGVVQEKRKETFNVNKGTTGLSSSAISANSKVVTYTIVLPQKNFRVVDIIGKHIKPNTTIVAMLEQDVAYVVMDKTNHKIYGKPRFDFLIALFLWVAFNIALLYLVFTQQEDILVSFNRVLWIGNITFGVIFLFSFTAYWSKSKTLRIFKQHVKKG